MTAHCPHCGKIITPSEAAAMLKASKTTEAMREAARKNGNAPVKPGNRPRGRPKPAPDPADFNPT